MFKRTIILLSALGATLHALSSSPSQYVDPRIGSEGLGRTYIGPTMPYGMIKPSPDAVSMPNSGWAPMPEPIKGFSQVHVSGTGGGQKYGNILIMPVCGDTVPNIYNTAIRDSEVISLGYYATKLSSGIGVEITTANKAALYQITYPAGSSPQMIIDAGSYLGMSPEPDGREAQQFVGSEIEVISDHVVKGYNRVRGGWNNGRAYTVYFYAVSDVPFSQIQTWKSDSLTDQAWQSDTHHPTGAVLTYPRDTRDVKLKIAISYLSELKARDNLYADMPDWDFDAVRAQNITAWDNILSRIELSETATDTQRRMLYTALYHTMIMPTDRSGENPLWADDTPYYDDYYAIWDTYRTSSPMITLIDPQRETDIINSMLSIYRRDGYLPDARSGNANGRTQGGSNAEIVIADAFVKGLKGIDYQLALDAMLNDADCPPGGNQEAEGRGGLVEYNSLGYIPYGIPRAGNRTVEYSLCDYAIAQVAKGLGKDSVADRFMRQSSNWQNLWRDDYEHLGAKGFIMPRDEHGNWLDSLRQGHSAVRQPKYAYTPVTFEGPWYTPWWDMFMYEASSWEYSLSVPHDVPGLIEKCGGKAAFETRLDTFFDQGIYNVNNEPSFMTPYLYHWIGKPWRSSDRIREIVKNNYSDTGNGLPGNDDSGAMSSWLAFNMIGIYPNAGTSYYLISSPMIDRTVMHLPAGSDFIIEAVGLSDANRYIQSASLNGIDYPYSTINHSELIKGGKLTLTMGDKPGQWGAAMAEPDPTPIYDSFKSAPRNEPISAADATINDKMMFVFRPHGQTRRYTMSFDINPDGSVTLTWGIERNLKWQSGTVTMTKATVESGAALDFSMPVDGVNITLNDNETAYIISKKAYSDIKRYGSMTYNDVEFKAVDTANGLIHVKESTEGTEMWILDNPALPIVWAMANNPLEVNWTAKIIKDDNK